jgi:hypothetical protein
VAPRRIKPPQPTKGAHITATQPVNYEANIPIFSLERLQDGNFCFSGMSQEHKAFFGDAVFRRRQLSWSAIKAAPRHGLGFEKISRDNIKAAIPAFIKDDVDHFLAFRFSGLRPMVGYRVRDIFYVLWFDHDFTLYKH